MPFTQAEIDYLAAQRLGRLATAQPDGGPDLDPHLLVPSKRNVA